MTTKFSSLSELLTKTAHYVAYVKLSSATGIYAPVSKKTLKRINSVFKRNNVPFCGEFILNDHTIKSASITIY